MKGKDKQFRKTAKVKIRLPTVREKKKIYFVNCGKIVRPLDLFPKAVLKLCPGKTFNLKYLSAILTTVGKC